MSLSSPSYPLTCACVSDKELINVSYKVEGCSYSLEFIEPLVEEETIINLHNTI